MADDKNKGTWREGEIREKHESFGMIGFNRYDNGRGRKLFGSALPEHDRTIGLRIYTNVERIHNLGEERYYAGNVPAIEVELSAAQFAELLTTMNVGFGIPCTVRSVGGKLMPEVPMAKHETEKVRDEFEQVFTKGIDRLREERAAVLKATEGKVSKKVADQIAKSFDMAIQALQSNAPFYLEQFEGATLKIVTQAKAEVDAFMSSTINRAGIKALKEGLVTVAETRALPEHSNEIDGREPDYSRINAEKE